ncbi:hypothetical protein J4467_00575 [Candidatus Woesearchaeota archaeon]|nr:hypothetical protein [Candidatus Woesearchaeota archaeon]
MKEVQINLSSDLAAISTYNTMLKAFSAGEQIPSGYLIDEAIAIGIQRRLLPRPMRGLYLDGIVPTNIRYPDVSELNDSPIAVAYNHKFDKRRLRHILEELSVNIEFHRKRLSVSDSEGLIGIYKESRLILPRNGLERFLKLAPPSLTGMNQDCFLKSTRR